ARQDRAATAARGDRSMTDDGERQLHEQFRVLRHHAGAGAPEFRDVVAGLVWRRESAGRRRGRVAGLAVAAAAALLLFAVLRPGGRRIDRKSTRLNSSHVSISYAVFCLKKKILSQATKCTVS